MLVLAPFTWLSPTPAGLHVNVPFKVVCFGNSLAVQWLGLSAFTARAQVPSLVGGTRILQAVQVAKKRKRKKKKKVVRFNPSPDLNQVPFITFYHLLSVFSF